MNEPNDPLLMDHEADGIRELDNKLPRWWVWLFYATILFSVVYLFYYHVLGSGNMMVVEYEKEMKKGDAIKSAAMARFESNIAIIDPSTEPAILDAGKDVYDRLCAPCHRADGGGLVGPNLTDDYWIHGDKFSDSVKTIWNGVPEKGMVMWKGVLKPTEILAAASYIYTLRGTHPPNPKPPENQAPAATEPNPYD
jgi:cytochrome c oxidase cbb3-type subunit III